MKSERHLCENKHLRDQANFTCITP